MALVLQIECDQAGGVLRLGNEVGARCGRRFPPGQAVSPQGERFPSRRVDGVVVVVASSTVGRVHRMERGLGSTESQDGWRSAMSSKYSGWGLADGRELLHGGPQVVGGSDRPGGRGRGGLVRRETRNTWVFLAKGALGIQRRVGGRYPCH